MGLSTLGLWHTLISLIALVSGFWSLVRYSGISPRNGAGKIYVVGTLLTAITALFIFQRGGFGPGHAMAIATLLALAVAYVTMYTNIAGKWAGALQILCFSSTLLFHFLAGFTETLTRVPLGNPLLPGPRAPQFLYIFGALFVAFLALVIWQLRAQRESVHAG